MTQLSVNINKVAVLRNSRGGTEPDPLEAARHALAAGCHGITVHPRPDQRHIRPADVLAIPAILGPAELNIEGNPFAPARGGYPGLLALVRLWCWTGEYRDDGRLHGVADDEIEFVAAGWTGEPGKFLGALLDLRWAERDEAGVISLHDWRDHNPYRATRTARVRAARTAAIVKACKKRGEHLPEETERELSEAALVRYYVRAKR